MYITPKIKSASHALVIALMFLFASGMASANVVQGSSSALDEARILVNAGKFHEALAILRPLAKAHPKHASIHFLVALSKMEIARTQRSKKVRERLLDEAIASFRTILADQPELDRVRLELARALFYKREDSLARRHFERVLAGEPPAPVVANIRRFLATIRARRR